MSLLRCDVVHDRRVSLVVRACMSSGGPRLGDTAARTEAVRLGSDRLGLAVEPGNVPAPRLYDVLGFEQTHLAVVDVWTWVDRDGSEYEERDSCMYWVQAISM